MSIIQKPQSKAWPFKTRAFFAGSVACLGLVLSSCTSTGNGSTALQLNSNANGSIIAEALQSAADENVADQETTKTDETKSADAKPDNKQPDQLAAVAPPVTQQTKQPETTTKATEEQPQAEATTVNIASAASTPKTSLFSLFGKKSETNAENTDQKVTTTNNGSSNTTTSAKNQTNTTSSPTQTTEVAFATPQRPASNQTSIARLFNEGSGNAASTAQSSKQAVIKPARSKHDYNYSLPGVRANAGIEIKHRNSLSDDSDIDADEYDVYPSVQLASAPGLARLAPNGLKVQRETVDVACLKPELVRILKQMERHFRRPVMVTSGYRSPTYNRKVKGARRSLHMICAAADIQIDGVPKTTLARYARSMKGRGGVGTYCHTKSVHVDVGPERDWNWRCRK